MPSRPDSHYITRQESGVLCGSKRIHEIINTGENYKKHNNKSNLSKNKFKEEIYLI